MGSLLSSVTKSLQDGILRLFGGRWHASTSSMGLPWTANRTEQSMHFRGWNYVAVRAICEEIACMPPQVCEIHDAEDVRAERQKSLHGRKGWRDVAEAKRSHARKYLSRGQRMKSLAHVQDSDELEPVSSDDPLVRLLKNPNGPDTAWSFFYKVPLYLELTGNCYIYVVDDKRGQPCQLWIIPSQWVFDQPGEEELIGSYLIRPTHGIVSTDSMGFGAGWLPGMGGQARVDASRIIKIAYPSAYSLVDGYSPLSATSTWNDVSEYIDQSRCQTFANGAYPGVLILLDKDMGAPDQPTMDRYKAKIDEAYGGVRRTGKSVILGPGVTMQSFRQSSVEMDYVASGTQMSDWQLAARGVPKSIVGLNEQESYASMIATTAGYYRRCIRPKLSLIGQTLTEKLAKRFGEKRVIHWPDPTLEDPAAVIEKWKWAKQEGLVTDNECRREVMGLDEWEFGGDDPEKAMGKIVVPYATGADPMQDLENSMNQQQQQPPGGDMGDDPNAALDDVMGELLGGDDTQSTDEPAAPGLPAPIAKRLGHLNGKVNGHAH